MEIGIVTFSVGSRTYKFKEPLILESENIEGKLCLSHEELTLFACGKSWEECSDIIREELIMLWEEYALASDSELPPGGIDFKNKLLGMVAEEAK